MVEELASNIQYLQNEDSNVSFHHYQTDGEFSPVMMHGCTFNKPYPPAWNVFWDPNSLQTPN